MSDSKIRTLLVNIQKGNDFKRELILDKTNRLFPAGIYKVYANEERESLSLLVFVGFVFCSMHDLCYIFLQFGGGRCAEVLFTPFDHTGWTLYLAPSTKPHNSIRFPFVFLHHFVIFNQPMLFTCLRPILFTAWFAFIQGLFWRDSTEQR